MSFSIDLEDLPCPIIAPSGEYAWSALAVTAIMMQAIENEWIVLGGDVISSAGEYTYDSWFYNTNNEISKKENVQLSTRKCLSFIDKYIRQNGNGFYFVLVLSDAMLV